MTLSKVSQASAHNNTLVASLPGMRHSQNFSYLLGSFLLLASTAQAQTGDWRLVQNIQVDTVISVQTQHRVKCAFLYATDTEVVCRPVHRGLAGLAGIGPSEFRFERQRVREVRLEHSDGHNAAVGAAIGAGAGAVFGAVGRNTVLNRGASTVVGGAFGGLAGGFLGVVLLPLRHGKVVYEK